MTSRRLTDEQILAYAAGELTGPDADCVEAGLAGDPGAARRVELYRLAQRRTAEDDSVAPPEALRARAKAIFRPAPSGSVAGTLAGWIDAATTAVAQLVYDSRVQPAAVRFQGVADRFQLTYEAGDVEVDLRAERLPVEIDGDGAVRWRVIGQVLGDDDAGVVEVAVLSAPTAAEPVATARSDERSLFTFDVEPGAYELRLRVGDRTLALADVHIE